MQESERTIIVGRNSKVWRDLSADPRLSGCIAIGHADVSTFEFTAGDRVWILSYSRDMNDNIALFDLLAASQAKEFVYVSTATANVAALTQCFGYPRVKHACEKAAQAKLEAHVVAIGVVYDRAEALPGGTTMASSLDSIATAISAARCAPGHRTNLFEPVARPFKSPIEKIAYRTYGALQQAAWRWPCLLRPVDVILRALGWRWYGYLYLSNRLWLTTTS